jgi:hypothetical protein
VGLQDQLMSFKSCVGLGKTAVAVRAAGMGSVGLGGVLGQLFDYMLRLHCFHGRDRVIGILSTYNEWRICELDFDKINERKMFATDIYHYDNQTKLKYLSWISPDHICL